MSYMNGVWEARHLAINALGYDPMAPWWKRLFTHSAAPQPLEPYNSEQHGRPVAFFCDLQQDGWQYLYGKELEMATTYKAIILKAYPEVVAKCAARAARQQAERDRIDQSVRAERNRLAAQEDAARISDAVRTVTRARAERDADDGAQEARHRLTCLQCSSNAHNHN